MVEKIADTLAWSAHLLSSMVNEHNASWSSGESHIWSILRLPFPVGTGQWLNLIAATSWISRNPMLCSRWHCSNSCGSKFMSPYIILGPTTSHAMRSTSASSKHSVWYKGCEWPLPPGTPYIIPIWTQIEPKQTPETWIRLLSKRFGGKSCANGLAGNCDIIKTPEKMPTSAELTDILE